jgi:hypothetical protein
MGNVELDLRMAPLENAENLVGKGLADKIDRGEIEQHLGKLLKPGHHAPGLGTRHHLLMPEQL